jgi:hypothetical protein
VGVDELRAWVEKKRKEIAFFATTIAVIVIGVIVPGGAGNAIVAVGGATLAIGILVIVGISERPHPERKRRWPY